MDSSGACGDETEEIIRTKYGYIPRRRKTFTSSLKSNLKCNCECIRNFVMKFVPILTWLPRYPLKKYAMGDLLAGITVAVVAMPQGMAYGLLAGLKPINGLYTAFFSPLVYLVFGTSRHLSVGIFSIISLMLGTALDKIEIDTKLYFSTEIVPSLTGLPKAEHAALMSVSSAPNDTVTNSTLSLLTVNDTGLSGHAGYTEEQNLAIIGSLTVLIGIVLVILGICQLGIVAMFLSEPLVSGFTTGAAFYVMTSQLKYVTGITLQRRSGVFGLIRTYLDLFTHITEIQWSAVILSTVCLCILVPIKYVNRTYKKQLRNIPIPVELFIVVLGTLVSSVANLPEKFSIRTVGPVPSGMPSPVLPKPSLWPILISDAISIAIVIFAVAVSLGKMFAKKHRYKIDPNQELFALGFCQLTCGFLQGHAGGGALARSTVQENSGANTQLASLVSCTVLLLVLLVLGPLFQTLPVACLSCIILANLHGLLMQFGRLPELWKLDGYDFSVWILTFVSVILLGVDLGLAAGLIFSLCCGALRAHKSKAEVLGVLPSTNIYRDVESFKGLMQVPGVRIVKFCQSPIYANKSALVKLSADIISEKSNTCSLYSDDCTEEMHNEMTMINNSQENEHFAPIKFVIFDCSSWNCIDTVGMYTLKQVIEDFKAAKMQASLAAVSEEIHYKLSLFGLLSAETALVKSYPSISHAVCAAKVAMNVTEDSFSTA